jgi:hypothetical protein
MHRLRFDFIPILSSILTAAQPSLTVITLEGDSVRIPNPDQPTMVYLWDAGNEFSTNEFTVLNALNREYADRVTFIAATTSKKEKVTDRLKEKEFTLAQVVGKEGKEVMKYFGNHGLIRTFPKHYILSKDGEILIEGIGSCSTIHQAIDSVLKGRTKPAERLERK